MTQGATKPKSMLALLALLALVRATGGSGPHAGLSLYVVTPTNPDNSNVLPVE